MLVILRQLGDVLNGKYISRLAFHITIFHSHCDECNNKSNFFSKTY